MKKFIWLSVSMESSSLLENFMDEGILKNYPYGAKYKTPVLEYHDIMIPLKKADLSDINFVGSIPEIQKHLRTHSYWENNDVLYTLFLNFRQIFVSAKTHAFDIHSIIDSDKFGILYTDGSYSKNIGNAGYACCKLTEQNAGGLTDGLTGDKFLHESFSGMIKDGTNNIGELTAIKVAVENFDEKDFQIIISDSIYGIKSYREYIHTWKNNGYKAYNKKEIKNKDLIIETYNKLLEARKSKIVLFCWTKGHADNGFNDQCDILAKGEIGL